MVALSSWIERAESAVADPFSRPGEADPHPKNRVGDFFRDTPNRVGILPSQVVDRVGETGPAVYDSRLATSLARSDEQVPGDGYGPIFSGSYSAEITTDMSAEELFTALITDINAFTDPPGSIIDAGFSSENGGDPVIELGAVLNIDIPGPVNPQVRVTGVTENSFTFTTLKGHPEAGRITFSTSSAGADRVNFNINSTFQSANRTSRAAYVLFGKRMQTRTWRNTLQQGIKRSGEFWYY